MDLPQPSSTSVEHSPARAPWLTWVTRFKRPLVAVAGVGAVLSGLAGWWNAYSTIHTAASAPSVATVQPTAAPAHEGPNSEAFVSIVVMPFANLTGDAQQTALADGLMSNIISAMVDRIEEVYVVPAATAITYRDKGLTVQQLGQALGVGYVLTGSVLGQGPTLRVTAQLADAKSGAHVWSHTFDSASAQAGSLQDRATAETVNGASVAMIVHAARESEKRGGTPTVADLRLRARVMTMQPMDEAQFKEQLRLQRQIIALQPWYVPTQVYYANNLRIFALEWEADDAQREQQKKDLAEARAIATKAAAAAPNNIYACYLMSTFAKDDGDIEVARRMFEQCLTIRPNSVYVMEGLASTYIVDGVDGARKAIELIRKAIDIEGVYPHADLTGDLGAALFAAGDTKQAIELLQLVSRADPNNAEWLYCLAMAYAELGDTAHLNDVRAKIPAAEAAAHASKPMTFERFEKGIRIDTPGYRALREARLLPLWRKAGLPI